MYTVTRSFALAALVALATQSARAAETFVVDPVHSSITFVISHQGISNIHGRFNDYSGKFVIDFDDPAKSTFNLSIKVASVDTANAKRDEHLCADDYFHEAKFPAITFQSSQVKPIDGGYEVTGDLTIHGVSKPITMKFNGARKTVEFPKGKQRVGLTTAATVKRSDFGMITALGPLGDNVDVYLGIEAAKE